MRRVGNLWEGLISWENLYESARRAAQGKRRRPDVAAFLFNLEPEVISLQRELANGEYVPGPYRTFQVKEPKTRLISAAPFRDRVVHHALTQVLEPIFERRFSACSYACRAGFGAHKALKKTSAACARYPHVLKCDVRKYFPSVDHEILLEQLARVVKCKRTLALAAQIVGGSNPQEEVNAYFKGDDLFAPFQRRRGLPLGNQTSQFFANVYLNPLDHFIARELRPGFYARYVDDFLLFGEDKRELTAWRERLVDFLEAFRLRIHQGKSRIYRVRDGVTFLGWRMFPDRMRLARGNVVRARQRLTRAAADYNSGILSYDEFYCRLAAWLGHSMHGNTKRIRQRILDCITLNPAAHHQNRGAGRLLEQQSTKRPGVEP